MSEKKITFICRNEQCHPETSTSGDTLNGGKILSFKSIPKTKVFKCKHCKSLHELIGEEIFLSKKEVILDSYEAYNNFMNQYGVSKIKINKLVLKDINEEDIKKKNFSFHQCRIQELLIENVQITSTFFPISFSECEIQHIKVINTRINRAELNSYKSLWNFFGISLIRSQVSDSFQLDNSILSLCIFSSAIKCPVDISGKSKIDFSSIRNKKEPEVKNSRDSKVIYFNEGEGRDPSGKQKKAKNNEDVTKNLHIEELVIDPLQSDPSLFENCTIHKLIFKSGADVQGDLEFKNCIIEHVENIPNSFQQNIKFLGTTFKQKLILAGANFMQSVIFECCTFTYDLVLNDLRVTEDLHLSYSFVGGKVHISDNNISGYMKCQVNDFKGAVHIQDNDIGRDVLLRYVNCEDDFTAYHNEIKGYLFLRQVNIKGETDLSLLNLEALTIDDLKAEKSFQSDDCSLNFDLNLNSLEVGGSFSIWSLKTRGSIRLLRSTIAENLSILSTDSNFNIFNNNTLKGSSIFSTCVYHKQTFIIRNIFEADINAQTMITANQVTSDNLIMGGMVMEDIRACNLSYDNNFTPKSLILKNSKLNDLRINNNEINEDLQVYNCRTDDIFMNGNAVLQKYDLNYIQASDFYFSKNFGKYLVVTNSGFSELSCTDCWELGDTNFSKLDIQRGMKFTDNHVLEELFLHSCTFGQELLIEYNTCTNFKLIKSKTTNVTFQRNFFTEGMNISQNKLADIDITESQVQGEFFFTNSVSDDVYIAKNYLNQNLELKSIKANNTEISYNNVKTELKIQFGRIEDLILKSCQSNALELSNSSFSEVRLSGSKNIDECLIFNISIDRDIMVYENEVISYFKMNICKAGNNIEMEKNSFKSVSLINSRANDLIILNNKSSNHLYINDNIANDIVIRENEIATELNESTILEMNRESDIKVGLSIHSTSVEDAIIVERNNTGDILSLFQNQSDKLSISNTKARECKLSMGSYRQVSVNYMTDVKEFKCNNVTIHKDLSFTNNIFKEEFSMLHCKIETDLDFKGNIFNGRHRLYRNTILGTLSYQTGHHEDENDSFDINTTFDMVLLMQHNRFNYIKMVDVDIRSTFYFEYNSVTASLQIGDIEGYGENVINFDNAISMKENKISHGIFNNLFFSSPLALRHNVFNGDLTFRNCHHQKVLDFTGSFVGGTMLIHNTDNDQIHGDLVLDDAFIDKRISFTNYTPESFSFINATFNGFEIPNGWKMRGGKLVRSTGDKQQSGQHKYAIKDDILRTEGYTKADLPYDIMREIYNDDPGMNSIPQLWSELQADIQNEHILQQLDQSHRREDKATDGEILRYFYSLFNQTINDDLEPIYYGYFNDRTLDDMAGVIQHLGTTENNYKDDDIKDLFQKIQTFFSLLHPVLQSFREHSYSGMAGKVKRTYRKSLKRRLEEQYSILRHIWGSNGELREEDIAYYRWMHYKNISDMQSASLKVKTVNGIKYLLYEKVFGWGVNLPRIVLSTMGVVVLFAIVYNVMFMLNPELTVYWDNQKLLSSEIGWGKSIVFAFQTTFSAVLGDWAPIGSGPIKIPMTINAVLGVLFVTFLIGAYGRKMLR